MAGSTGVTKEGAGGLSWSCTLCPGHPPESLGHGMRWQLVVPQPRQDKESSCLLFWFLLL